MPGSIDSTERLTRELQRLHREVVDLRPSQVDRVWKLIEKGLLTLSTTAIAGVVVWAIGLDQRVTRIESNRLTATELRDHLTAMQQQMMLRQDMIRDALASLTERLVRLETTVKNGK